jgi:hypothetical protein
MLVHWSVCPHITSKTDYIAIPLRLGLGDPLVRREVAPIYMYIRDYVGWLVGPSVRPSVCPHDEILRNLLMWKTGYVAIRCLFWEQSCSISLGVWLHMVKHMENQKILSNSFCGPPPEHIWASGPSLRIIEENKEFSGSYTGLESKANRLHIPPYKRPCGPVTSIFMPKINVNSSFFSSSFV